MNAIPSRSQYSSTSSETRSTTLYRFCTDTIGATARARSISSTVTSGEAEVADLALPLQVGELSDLVLERCLRADPVELEEIDPLEPEVGQVDLDGVAQIDRQRRAPSTGPGPAE